MENKIKKILKEAIVIIISIAMIMSGIFSSISIAQATSLYSQLGTNKALCSPILNGNNYSEEDWNRWEMIVWGIFLSNFCQPLIDDYQSAFNTGAGGSNGAGFKALAFGSGNDSANNKLIKDFCSYAIGQQKQSARQLYVTYNKLVDNKIVIKSDPNMADSEYRAARFKDFFITSSNKKKGEERVEDDGTKILDLENAFANISVSDVYEYYTDGGAVYNGSRSERSADLLYSDMSTYTAYVPTFWLKTTDNKFVKVLDYTDPWDIQIVSSIMGKIANTDYQKDFLTAFESNYDNNVELKLDCFGNIVTSQSKIILPAAANQHLTVDRKVNLLNSLVLNNNTGAITSRKLVESAAQYEENNFDFGTGLGDLMLGDAPALSGSTSKLKNGQTFVFYDLTTAVMSKLGNHEYSTFDYGNILMDFFNKADINEETQKYNLRIETVNKLSDGWSCEQFSAKSSSFGDNTALIYTQLAASLISTHLNTERQPEYLTQITFVNGDKTNIFGTPVAIPVGADINKDTKHQTMVLRRFYNFLYKSCKDGIKTISGDVTAVSLQKTFQDANTINEMATDIEDRGLVNHYKLATGDDVSKFKVKDFWSSNDFSKKTSRIIIAYPTSDVMTSVADILGLSQGTEFSVYSPYIYMTYLEWYGIIDSYTGILKGEEATSELNEDIFDPTLDATQTEVGDVADTQTPEDTEKAVLNLSYLMLSPEEGRQYRSQIQRNAMTDWILDNYEKMTFGDTSGSYLSTGDGSGGFLAIDSYSENMFTSAFIENYVNICVWLIMILFVLMIVIGLLKGRKLIWFITTSFVIVTTILLMPSSGELVPYFSSNLVQRIFSDNMTNWSINEAITNASIEKDMARQKISGVSADEAEQIVYLVKQLNVINLDRSLMIKKDISSKTLPTMKGSYSEIQSIASARWILPVVMRQFSQEDAAADYLYIPVGDLMDDFSNLYWMYDSNNAQIINGISPTYTSGDTPENDDMSEQSYTNPGGTIIDDAERSEIYDDINGHFLDYKKMENNSLYNNSPIDYRSISYRVKDPKNLVHTYSFIIDGLTIPSRNDYFTRDTYNPETSFESYASTGYTKAPTNFTHITRKIEDIAGTYDRADRDTMQSVFGYLWATESSSHYFYQLVKDSFKPDISLGELIGKIQGQYNKDENGIEVRDNFMYATKNATAADDGTPTGYVRDILDLECMFNNLVPYLYQTQLIAGGTDGEHGALQKADGTPEKIDDSYPIYEGENLSFLYRSNWVVKLMECPEYNKTMTVKDSNGTKYNVLNPLLPDCYPDARPMVFSEAQMKYLNLDESDLNVIELKCLEANKQVAKKWTLLINYAGTGGITCEVLMRQMALDATMIFNEVFSPTAVIGLRYSLLPQSLDLRNISFDSVMKMLMINVTKDNSYIYGNTMRSVIESSDILVQLVLLAVTWMCSVWIPFIRNLLMAFLFYMGILAALRSILADNKFKMKVVGGQLISNILFLVLTMGYYLVFYAMLEITNVDDVLTKGSLSANPGNPIWMLIIIGAASIAYIALMHALINLCYKNSRDMGMHIYQSFATSAVRGVSNKLKSIKSDLDFRNSDGKSGGASGSSGNSSKKPMKKDESERASKGKGGKAEAVEVKPESAESKKRRSDQAEKKQDQQSSGYNYKVDKDTESDRDIEAAANIDSKIKGGESTNK